MRSEVSRRRKTSAAGIDPALPEPDQALAALEAVRVSIDELDDIAGLLARAAVAHAAGGPTSGSSLRLSAHAARSAYESLGRRSLD